MHEHLQEITDPLIAKGVKERLLFLQERKDGGLMRYTTISETIKAWAEDPHGDRTMDFVSWVNGIPRDEVEAVFQEAGLSEYIQAKQEGRFVSMVATQILKPTHYYMSNLLANAELSRMGIPTAVLVMDCPEDTFHKDNHDKGGAFGKIKFPVPFIADDPIVLAHENRDEIINKKKERENKKRQEGKWIPPGVIELEIQPYAIRHDDGSIQRISSVNEAEGYRCEQILVHIVDAKGPQNMRYTSDSKTERYMTRHTHVEAALGISIPYVNTKKHTPIDSNDIDTEIEDSISLTDFYRILWEQSIENMRSQGILPPQEVMPIIRANATQIYTTFASYAHPPEAVKEILHTQSEKDVLHHVLHTDVTNEDIDTTALLREQNLYLSEGMLLHANGMMDPASYYPFHVAIPDLYLECSSCGGPKFVGKLRRAQEVREIWNIPNKQVRLPDDQIPDLEEYLIHPGSWIDMRNVTRPYDYELAQRDYEFSQVKRQVGKTATVADKEAAYDKVHEVRQSGNQVIDDILHGRRNGYTVEQNTFIIPDAVREMYIHMFTGVDETVLSPKVQSTVRLL